MNQTHHLISSMDNETIIKTQGSKGIRHSAVDMSDLNKVERAYHERAFELKDSIVLSDRYESS